MLPILKDFWRKNLSDVIGRIIQLIAAVALPLFNIRLWENDIIRTVFHICLAFIAAISIYYLLCVFVITPLRLRKQLSALQNKDEMLAEYKTAKRLSGHVFLDKCFFIFGAGKIELLEYSDIRVLEKQGGKLRLVAESRKKPLVMSFSEYGANAITAAYLKSKNPKVKFSERTNQE